MKKIISTAFVILLINLPYYALADTETPSYPHVAADEYGRCYARSIPRPEWATDEDTRQAGVTKFYIVSNKVDHDLAVHTYDWFAQKTYVMCGHPDNIIVRMGPWARGQDASDDDLAFAFYNNGKLVKRYSTLDIAGDKENVMRSLSHYWIIKEDPVAKWDGKKWIFSIKTFGDEIISFNPSTGEKIEGK
jgi:hypothetical protein